MLACPHACANCVLLRVLEHSWVSLIVHACYTKGCTHACGAQVDTYTYDTHVSPTWSRQSLRRIVSQNTYSSDIVSDYSELVSGELKILTSREMYKFHVFVPKKKDGIYEWVGYRQLSNICDRAYENRLCQRKLHWVILLLISFVPNALSHCHKLQKKAH